MKKIRIYSVGLVVFACLEVLMPDASFIEAVLVTVLLLIAEVLCVKGVPFTEKEKIQLWESYEYAITLNNKALAIKLHQKLEGCGKKEAKVHVEKVLAKNNI